MTFRTLGFAATIAAVGVLATAAHAAPYHAPRTADGHPNLQGIWTNATLTPLERDAKYGDRLALTDQEVAAIEGDNAKGVADGNKPTNPNFKVTDLPQDCGRGFTGVNCGYNSAWVDPGTTIIDLNGVKRSSIITSPANGKTPPMTKDAAARMQARFAGGRGGPGSSDNPENRSLGERCLMSFGSSAGPPMLPLLYNNTYQIVQSGPDILIEVEMVHDARIIHMTDKHLPASVKQWMGDSIGHWEGDTLVVETTNMRPEQAFRGASPQLKITERFTRVNDKQIEYRFTVSDPEIYTAPYSGEVALNATKGPIYEYACHEGNYALPGILAGAREEEKQALNSAKPAPAGGGGK